MKNYEIIGRKELQELLPYHYSKIIKIIEKVGEQITFRSCEISLYPYGICLEFKFHSNFEHLEQIQLDSIENGFDSGIDMIARRIVRRIEGSALVNFGIIKGC